MADVEMKPAESTATPKAEEKPAVVPATPVAEIKSNLALIERAVSSLEVRFTHRALRTLTALRKKIDEKVLFEAISQAYASDAPEKSALLVWLPSGSSGQTMEIDDASNPAQTPLVPEGEVYLRLLVLNHLLASSESHEKAKELAHETVSKIQAWNRRSMDPIAAKVWYALGRAHELLGDFGAARPLFLAAQRTAALRHDEDSEAVLLNLLLRNYLHYNLYDQADKLVSKTTFPESAGNPQVARYHFSVGLIRVVQLNYSEARTHFEQAIRRAPSAKTAPGFYQTAHKFAVVVELLMGDIPERGLFRHPVLEKALLAYFEIVKAVRTGSLSQFQTTLAAHSAQFQADKTLTLIVRLRQNVIKTGIRRLSLSYSRISLRDICVKLHLDSEEDAEYIVGKAIRDGVIEGRVIHEKGWMECGNQKGGYGPEVADVFQRRIGYCLDLHNDSLKAMRFPLNPNAKKDLVAARDAREREKETAKAIAEGDDDDMDEL